MTQDPKLNKKEQMLERARAGVDRTELTNMLYDLGHVHEVTVDGEDEPFPVVITVGFDDKGHRDSADVIDIMRLAGYQPEHVVFSPYNRIVFEPEDA